MQDTMTVDQRPAFAAVIAAIKTTFLRFAFDDRVDALRIAGRYVDADFPNDSRKPTFEFLPVIAAIGRLEDSSLFTPGLYELGFAAMLPHRGVEYARVARVH